MIHRALAIVVLAAATLTGGAAAGFLSSAVVKAADPTIPHHTFHPTALLDDYTELGLPFWSFGASAVLTSHYARLTPALGAGHGYLWNQYPTTLSKWRAAWTVKVSQKPHHTLFGSVCQTCGVALWFLTEPTRHSNVPFFGAPRNFVGVGVIVHADGVAHLVQNNGEEAQTLASVTVGTCPLSLGTAAVQFRLSYSEDDGVTVEYAAVADPPTSAPLAFVPCTTAKDVQLPSRSYFGMTAASELSSPMGFDVVSFTVTSLGEEQAEDADADKALAFDANLEKEEKARANSGDDTQIGQQAADGGMRPESAGRDSGKRQQQDDDQYA